MPRKLFVAMEQFDAIVLETIVESSRPEKLTGERSGLGLKTFVCCSRVCPVMRLELFLQYHFVIFPTCHGVH